MVGSLSVGREKQVLTQERGVLLTPSVGASRKPNHTKHGNKNDGYRLAWWGLWWKRMEREGEKDEQGMKRELESRRSSGLMKNFLTKNKSDAENEDMEKMKRSIVDLTAVTLLELRGKKRTNSITGTTQSPAKRGNMFSNESLGFRTNLVEREKHAPCSDKQPGGETRTMESGD